MVDYEDIKLALIKAINVAYCQDPEDHVRRVAKQLVQDEATYME
ncbi:7787_t:CDS:2 [Entrophospora sp. SA101]|nr:7173_t:CDS:2 [Entrophospora sp. SA101]CAJ0636097.1 9788_t:CDS:2 [Entrophospora sp. SA101]CAJ0763997.1 7787_t:CDS:2 [Entrophospora sp. SA101]CAJ0842521.1 2970_t:CDS:2 [Entrophospora sp. SA101]CAJ0862001.1 11518_t:CDS:2 [Entrophospora sp. SA101]